MLGSVTSVSAWFGSVLLFLIPAAYQVLAIIAELRHIRQKRQSTSAALLPSAEGISVLKPLHGLDPNTRLAFISQIEQQIEQVGCPFEILFAVRDADDPAAAEVRHLQAEYPGTAILLYTGKDETANGKVGLLMELARHARYPVWVVNDSDILVTPDYLATVAQPLADPAVGVVTCLYRARAHTTPATWESLGIATDFMPSTLVAQLIGVREFGLGSTLAFRASDLAAIGGFNSFADYLADDYQLSKRITSLGKRTVLSRLVVETSLGDASWTGIWNHQLRWARTIRASKGLAYSGVFITQAGLWILLLSVLGHGQLAAILGVLRVMSAFLTTSFILADVPGQRLCWLAPVWDLYAFCIWFTAHFGRTVRWRGRTLRIDPEGRILDVE